MGGVEQVVWGCSWDSYPQRNNNSSLLAETCHACPHLCVVVALPGQLSDGAVPQPAVHFGHGGRDVNLIVSIDDLVEEIGGLVEPCRWRRGGSGEG